MSNLSKTVELKELIENIKGIYESTNLLEILTDYERVLDNLDVYAYKNWGRGELAEGPISTRYWVTCKFIWPKKMPPDPLFIKRMQNNGIDVSVHTGDLNRPKHVESREDFKPGTFYPKLVKHPVWVVEISIPKHLTQEVEKGYMDLGGEKMDLSELDQAYDEDLDKQGAVNQGTEENFSG